MKKRLHLRNDTHMIEWTETFAGLLKAKGFRQSHPEFKGCRIRSIVQLNPEQVECGRVYPLTYE